MRRFAVVLVVPFLACGSPGRLDPDAHVPDTDADADAGPSRGFLITTPTFDVHPGEEVTYCYYFHTPNAVDMSIKQWSSHMSTGGQHVVLYLTPTDLQTPGTVSTTQCGITNRSPGPVWTYAAQGGDDGVVLPADDGTGTPLGQMITAGHSAFVQVQYTNTTSATLHAQVGLTAYAHDEGVRVTPVGSFFTLNRRIDLLPATPSGPTAGLVNGDCTVGADAKFFLMTTHTYKQGVHTFVKDGGNMLVDSTSWQHPNTMTWGLPFYSFTSGKLSYQCEYLNPTTNEITSGDSAATDEMCMAIGYYFPTDGTSAHFCLNSMMLY